MKDKIKEIIRNNSSEVNQYGFKAIEIRKGELNKIADEIVKFCNLHFVRDTLIDYEEWRSQNNTNGDETEEIVDWYINTGD